jgi:hypothetical protein
MNSEEIYKIFEERLKHNAELIWLMANIKKPKKGVIRWSM